MLISGYVDIGNMECKIKYYSAMKGMKSCHFLAICTELEGVKKNKTKWQYKYRKFLLIGENQIINLKKWS